MATTGKEAAGPWGTDPPAEHHRRAYADASTVPFWLDADDRPDPRERLEGDAECDLAIVGGGLTGLWAAVRALEREPGRDVLLVDAAELANAASGRNGGFFLYSLTHGVANGLARFPDELPTLERLGIENFAGAVATIERHGIDCALEQNGDILVALESHEEAELAELAGQLRELGHDVVELDRDEVRGELDSPTYRRGLWQRNGSGLVDPARLCWGLAKVATQLGARIHERTEVRGVGKAGSGVVLRTATGEIRARQALLATAAHPGLVRQIRRRVVPVYDYVLVSEPLTTTQRAAIGWQRRQGTGDSANQFHYYRLTRDDRILWGGYDAIYHYGSRLASELEQREETFARLSQHFFTTFPQLEGLRFTHRWGGAIDTCSRFFAFYGTTHAGRVAHAVGHTGLGVGASRFAADVGLDLLAGEETEATRLKAVRSRPIPFPPEPLRWAAIELTRNRLAAADRNAGRRGAWLRLLDRLGLGYDS